MNRTLDIIVTGLLLGVLALFATWGGLTLIVNLLTWFGHRI